MKVITRLKNNDVILNMLEEYGRVFIVGCGTCPVVCGTGGIEAVTRMEKFLTDSGKLVTGNIIINAACDTSEDYLKREAGGPIEQAQAFLIMSCGLGVQNISSFEMAPCIPALDSLFFGLETSPNKFEEVCLQCGECILGVTGGICPVTSCHKGLLNGPCGGMNEGMCEVGEGRECAWVLIYKRLEKAGRLDLMKRINEPRNFNAHLKPGRWEIQSGK